MPHLSFAVDESDCGAIMEALARRQALRCMPDYEDHELAESDLRGRLLAEICRGWLEFMSFPPDE